MLLGRIHKIKGLNNLISAAYNSNVFKKSNYKIIIAGNKKNKYALELEKEVNRIGMKDKIIFPGHISGKKQALLAESKWLILPSFSENFGIVVIEALAQSTPVIASFFSPWKSLIHNSSGFWISNDSISLSNKLDEIIKFSSDKQRFFQTNAIKHANLKFCIYKNINTWLQAYYNLKNGNKEIKFN